MDERSFDPSGPYDPFQVNIPLFDGPLDLLLHLVRRQALDINELRLADLTEPYLAYVERMQEVNLDQAGEFLTIASTLIWIKSRTLLPRQFDDEEPDPDTVEEMLLLRLQEYQRIKEAAHELASMDVLGRDIFPRQAPREGAPPSDQEPEFEEVSLFALIEALREVLERTNRETALHLIPERERMEDRLRAILSRLARHGTISFHELIGATPSRPEIIIAFIALLELVRLRAVRVIQAPATRTISCEVTEAFSEDGANWTAQVMRSLFGEEEEDAAPDPLEHAPAPELPN